MADLSQLEQALIKADAAGDTEGARILAAEVRKARAQPKESAIAGAINRDPGVGMAEATASLGTGAAGSVVGGLAGLGSIATNALGLTNKPSGDVVRDVAGAMTYVPRTKAGQVITETAAAPFELLAKGADKAGGAVTDVTGSPAAGAAVNTAINAAPMALGPLARAVPGESAASIAARAKAKSLNAPTDAGLEAARKSGLVVTPSEAKAGPIATTMEGLAGEPKVSKLNSKTNAPTFNAMIRRDVGLPEDVPITRDSLAQIRKEEGAHYEAVKNTGRVQTDAQFKADLYEANKSINVAAEELSHRADSPFKKTYEGLNVDSMNAKTLVEEVKNLRYDADAAYAKGDKQLGSAYKKSAEALDDMLDRHLKRNADPAMADAVARYQEARQRIAKTYAAEKALNETTGNINAGVYGAELKKGKKLSGEGLAVAQFARQFPRSSQLAEKTGNTGPTFMDLGLSLVGKDALLLGARPAARHLMLSDMAQKAYGTRSYGPSRIRRLQDLLEEVDPKYGAAGTAAGQR